MSDDETRAKIKAKFTEARPYTEAELRDAKDEWPQNQAFAKLGLIYTNLAKKLWRILLDRKP